MTVQEMHNGLSKVYNSCNLCGEPITAGKWINGKMVKSYVKMTVFGRSEKRNVHCTCINKYIQVDNTKTFVSTKVRKNGIINFAKISVNADNVAELKSYLISAGYTYVRANQNGCTFLSPRFSGFSSLSKMIFNATKRIEGFTIKNVDLYNADNMNTVNVFMKYGKNTDYTIAGRYFNEGKIEKLNNFLKELN
jgi:hypothetical protein